MLQMYEHQRDDMLTTTCWRKRNDFCAPHFHSSIELVYTLSGCLSATVDGQIIELTEGQLLLNSSYTIHSYSTERDAETVIVIIPLP
ncbi:MAG: cupin domain-containing protein, partial [Christensenellaceae bacterium]